MKKCAESVNSFLKEMADCPVGWNEWDADSVRESALLGRPLCVCVVNSESRWSYAMKAQFCHADVAKLLNDDFIPVMCDSEDCPNVTLAGRAMAQIMLGHAGWPLFLFLTPRREPIFAASYMPLQGGDTRYPGFLDVLRRIKWLWLMKRAQLNEAAASYAAQLKEAVLPFAARLEADLAERAVSRLREEADDQNGGWGRAPKFPQASKILLAACLCRLGKGGEKLRGHLRATLTALCEGALYDPIAGGFHRYCMDAAWRAPALGKRTARNAAILAALLEGWRIFADEGLLSVFDRTADFLLSEFDRGDGLLRAGESASAPEKLESLYLWNAGEIEAALGARVADLREMVSAQRYLDPATGEKTGKYVLLFSHPGAVISDNVRAVAARLAEARRKRERPPRDTRVFLRDNAWMAAVLARAARLTDDGVRLGASLRLVARIEENFVGKARLFHALDGGAARGNATLEDVSALVWAYIELYRADSRREHLDRAREWAEQCDAHFGSVGAPFPVYEVERELLPARDAGDDFLPSGTAMMTNNLVSLYRLTGDSRWLSRARDIVDAYGGALNEYPAVCAGLSVAALRAERCD